MEKLNFNGSALVCVTDGEHTFDARMVYNNLIVGMKKNSFVISSTQAAGTTTVSEINADFLTRLNSTARMTFNTARINQRMDKLNDCRKIIIRTLFSGVPTINAAAAMLSALTNFDKDTTYDVATRELSEGDVGLIIQCFLSDFYSDHIIVPWADVMSLPKCGFDWKHPDLVKWIDDNTVMR